MLAGLLSPRPPPQHRGHGEADEPDRHQKQLAERRRGGSWHDVPPGGECRYGSDPTVGYGLTIEAEGHGRADTPFQWRLTLSGRFDDTAQHHFTERITFQPTSR